MSADGVIDRDPIATQTAVLHAAGIGIQALTQRLERAEAELAARNDRATANLERLDRITLRLYVLAEELNGKGGKVSARKLADRILAIRGGAA